MRKRNWCQYNKSLVQRGSLTFLIDPKIMKDLGAKAHKKKGRPLEFSDQLILILLIDILRNIIYLLKLLFLADLIPNFLAICLHMSSKFEIKSAQKLSIFSSKAGYAKSAILADK